MTRREAIRLLGSVSAGALLAAAQNTPKPARAAKSSSPAAKNNLAPALAPGAPMSPERLAIIEHFKQASDGLEKAFEARTHKSDWIMPYRLFRPAASGKLPLVLYLHGSGGQGTDNLRQLGLGNIFGTRLWLLPQNQKTFPCYVVAPQTDRGWCRYDLDQLAKGVVKALPGLGDGSRLALEIVDALCRDFPIDERRIYVAGQSMGGAGAWNVITHRPQLFAAAVICCASNSTEDGTAAITMPLWNFHGDADDTVPVSVSRGRMAARRKAGGHPLYTEYQGVGHEVYEWAFTEPELVKWVFSQQRDRHN